APPPVSSPPTTGPNTRLLLIIGVAAAVVVGLLGLLTAGYFLGLKGGTGKRGDTKAPPSKAAPETVTATVFKVGRGQTDTTVKSALARAKKGDRIVLTDAEHREYLTVVNLEAADVSIEAADSVKEVTWRPLASADDIDFIVDVAGTKGLKFKGLRFDGEGKCKTLLKLADNNPGLTVEDVKLQGFTRCAVLLWACKGTSDHPVQLQRVTVVAKV